MTSKALSRFLARAQDLGVDVEIDTFPDGTRTAVDAAAAIGCQVAQIVKSLVFIADDAPVLALTSGANRVDETKLAAELASTGIRKADAAEAREATGYAIGGTPPFGHDTPITVVFDRDLAGYEQVWAAAGTPMAVFALAPQTLLEVTGAKVVDLSA